MLVMLDALAAAHGPGAHVLGPRALRLGPVSVAFTLGPADLAGMSDRYDDFLASRTPVRLRRGASADEIPAIGVEALLATKLTRRGDKAKDLFDVTQLLAALADAGRSVDLEKVRRLVAGDAQALALLEEIAQLGPCAQRRVGREDEA